jgi:hypothetical protein
MGIRIRGKHRSGGRRCKNGEHSFAEPTSIGGGLVRSVCADCGEVTIDLRSAEEPTNPGLFTDVNDGRHLGRRRADTSR